MKDGERFVLTLPNAKGWLKWSDLVMNKNLVANGKETHQTR